MDSSRVCCLPSWVVFRARLAAPFHVYSAMSSNLKLRASRFGSSLVRLGCGWIPKTHMLFVIACSTFAPNDMIVQMQQFQHRRPIRFALQLGRACVLLLHGSHGLGRAKERCKVMEKISQPIIRYANCGKLAQGLADQAWALVSTPCVKGVSDFRSASQ